MNAHLTQHDSSERGNDSDASTPSTETRPGPEPGPNQISDGPRSHKLMKRRSDHGLSGTSDEILHCHSTTPGPEPVAALDADLEQQDAKQSPLAENFGTTNAKLYEPGSTSQDVMDNLTWNQQHLSNEQLACTTQELPLEHGTIERSGRLTAAVTVEKSGALDSSTSSNSDDAARLTINGQNEQQNAVSLEDAITDSSQQPVGGVVNGSTAEDDEIIARTWIYNDTISALDRSWEKLYVTYNQKTATINAWRRLTITLDYRGASKGTLQAELTTLKDQVHKSVIIYNKLKKYLPGIRFFPTVTNILLHTDSIANGQPPFHVAEDIFEVVEYPNVRNLLSLGCRIVLQTELEFDSHISGFVYKVRLRGQTFIHKEVPGAHAVTGFLYELDALHRLKKYNCIMRMGGIVVDDNAFVKGLLIEYATEGTLLERLQSLENLQDPEAVDNSFSLELQHKWAYQIVHGLAKIHEEGFVHGDLTLRNMVIDGNNDAKIIDLNQGVCEAGWEPPEIKTLMEQHRCVPQHNGVKVDLYQLGMVLWALAAKHPRPESLQRLQHLTGDEAPFWYHRIVQICLEERPYLRKSAESLLSFFPTKRDWVSTSIRASPLSAQSIPKDASHDYCEDAVMLSPVTKPVWHSTPYSVLEETLYPERGRSPPRHAKTYSKQQFSWKDDNLAKGWETDSIASVDTDVSQNKQSNTLRVLLPSCDESATDGEVEDNGNDNDNEKDDVNSTNIDTDNSNKNNSDNVSDEDDDDNDDNADCYTYPERSVGARLLKKWKQLSLDWAKGLTPPPTPPRTWMRGGSPSSSERTEFNADADSDDSNSRGPGHVKFKHIATTRSVSSGTTAVESRSCVATLLAEAMATESLTSAHNSGNHCEPDDMHRCSSIAPAKSVTGLSQSAVVTDQEKTSYDEPTGLTTSASRVVSL